ncbi:protein adenylyltransferase SelO [Virgibacillus sp. W0430]|uniref:protein adenylyltransferase SelO n=1 Tax=Virgibacillus sp. W0430 TaxID=3391580 RepID=UPI003F44EED9
MSKNKTTCWNLENSYTKLPKRFFAHIHPTIVKDPAIVLFNEGLAEQLGLSCTSFQAEEVVKWLSGNAIPPQSKPLAQAYAGHQFGNFTRLGDGRAILLGEQITPEGHRVDIQLKGAGRTPYSRGGDGRAALGPMLREYIISEALHALHIPTTRSLAVVSTGESILREKELPGAILTRSASSHIRVGTFQYAAAWGSLDELQCLADYVIKRHYPNALNVDNRYIQLYKEVIDGQAALIAKWQLVGFVHGVMNTDNMTISGESIDYGPCAFMDAFDPATVFSSIDQTGRYAYGNQPAIGGWNLARFAEALLPLFHKEKERAIKIAQDVLSSYDDRFLEYWQNGMRSKLGLINKEPGDEKLISDLLDLMKKHKADYTNTFIALTNDKWGNHSIYNEKEFKQWHQRWKKRKNKQQASNKEIHTLMQSNNPAVIPRNHRVEEALNAAVEHGDTRVVKELVHVLSTPYAHTEEKASYQQASNADTPYRTFCGT